MFAMWPLCHIHRGLSTKALSELHFATCQLCRATINRVLPYPTMCDVTLLHRRYPLLVSPIDIVRQHHFATRPFPTRVAWHRFRATIPLFVAGIVYRYYESLPRTRKGFDSPYPLTVSNNPYPFGGGYCLLPGREGSRTAGAAQGTPLTEDDFQRL